jgi:hypothetical protein
VPLEAASTRDLRAGPVGFDIRCAGTWHQRIMRTTLDIDDPVLH